MFGSPAVDSMCGLPNHLLPSPPLSDTVPEQTHTSKPTQSVLQERALVKSKFALSAMNMFRACMDREVLLVQRNLFLYGFRTVQTIIIAVCVVLTFFHSRMPTNSQSDGGKFFSVLFFSLLIIMFDGCAPGSGSCASSRNSSPWVLACPAAGRPKQPQRC